MKVLDYEYTVLIRNMADQTERIAIDAQGNIYISDTRPSARPDSRIYRFRNGEFEVWMQGGPINWANGLFVHENELLVGNSGDGKLEAIDLTTKHVRDIICLGARVLDGIGCALDAGPVFNHPLDSDNHEVFEMDPDEVLVWWYSMADWKPELFSITSIDGRDYDA